MPAAFAPEKRPAMSVSVHRPRQQAADKGRVRVALEQRLQFAVEFDEAGAIGEGLSGRFLLRLRGIRLRSLRRRRVVDSEWG
jgi:hypothetical protein